MDERNPRALEHEQVHFDIAEFYARTLSAELHSLRARAKSETEALGQLEHAVRARYADLIAAWQEMEDRYDRETNHGGRPIPQEQWRRRLRELMPSAGKARMKPGEGVEP
ncbi:MAG: DUF922 domain-containing protein [Myxococcota bacterium]